MGCRAADVCASRGLRGSAITSPEEAVQASSATPPEDLPHSQEEVIDLEATSTENNSDHDAQIEQSLERLFVHKDRPEWGVGLLVAEGPSKRRIRFQDGVLRAFKKGWYHMLEPYEASPSAATTVLEELEEEHDALDAEERKLEKRASNSPSVSFSDQVMIFEHLYPGGFSDPAWLDAVRRPSDGRFRKRHVEAIVANAQEKLSEDALGALIEAGDFTAVHGIMAELLDSTSLASPSKMVRPMRGVPAERHEDLARALHTLLYGEAKYRERLRDWILTLEASGLPLTWPMVTLLPALVDPAQHVCVKRSAFHDQSRSLMPDVIVRKHPTPRSYRRVRQLAQTVRERLVEAGHEPADMFDIRAFVWETLRPRGKEILAEAKKARK